MDAELIRQAKSLFGDDAVRRQVDPAIAAAAADPAEITPDPGASTSFLPPLIRLQLSPRQTSRLWRHVETIDGFWETLKECEPGVVARLAGLAADRRWEILFVTKRPDTAGATAQVQSQRWLETHGFALPSVYVVHGSRGRIAAALGLDFVVDDRPENCLDVVTDSKARALLVWRDDQKLVPAAATRLAIGVVPTVAACLEILTHIDSPTSERPGVVDRVMRLLGLKDPAGG